MSIVQFPHCDCRVLHAPEDDCRYCNHHPDWQQLRQTWNIAFTGHDPLPGQVACPAERERPRETINRWGGNRVIPDDGVNIVYDYNGTELVEKYVIEDRSKFKQKVEKARKFWDKFLNE